MAESPANADPACSVDVHTHIFCWGENPEEGYLSDRTRNMWKTRLILKMSGILKEKGETISEKMRNRLIRHIQTSGLDYAVVLAQDAVYHEDGSRNDPDTHFYVSNDHVFSLAKECPQVLPGCSINPIRSDALQELERCREAGARLVKLHTAIQGVDPSRAEFDPFYKLANELGVVLMFHTGWEHSCKVISQQFTDPLKLERPLDHGGPVIAAHCGSCAWYDKEQYYPRFVEMMNRYENLFGDTAIMASVNRWFSLRKLSREEQWFKERILHGSDYPFPPARLPFLFRTGPFPRARKNPLDLDLRIKDTFKFGPGYASRVLELLGVEQGSPTGSPPPTPSGENPG
ncbi:MAG: amidohydrolase family protein [Planctomycetota bacterium]